MTDYGDSITRADAGPLTPEKVSDVALDHAARKRKSAADLQAELNRHKSNCETMNKAIREKMAGG